MVAIFSDQNRLGRRETLRQFYPTASLLWRTPFLFQRRNTWVVMDVSCTTTVLSGGCHETDVVELGGPHANAWRCPSEPNPTADIPHHARVIE